MASKQEWEHGYKARPLKAEEWEPYHDTIRRLYIDQNLELPEVRKIMATEHNFYAKETQYRKKLEQWNLGKNIPRRKIQTMRVIQDRRALEGKDTWFRYNGWAVKENKLQHQKKRQKTLKLEELSSLSIHTPSLVSYGTSQKSSSVILDDTRTPADEDGKSILGNVRKHFETEVAGDNSHDKETSSPVEDVPETPFPCNSAQARENELFAAIIGGDEQLVKKFLASHTCFGDEYLASLLRMAVSNDRKEIAALLLDKGADVNPRYGPIPLHLAASSGYTEVVRLLLDKGAEVNVSNHRFMESPLCAAVRNSYIEIVQLLLDKGADAKDRDFDGEPLLLMAIRSGCVEVVQLLLDGGAGMSEESTPFVPDLLYYARTKGTPEIVQLLLNRGALCNIENIDSVMNRFF